MAVQTTTRDGDLFNEALIRSYVDDNPRFVERDWLWQRVQTALFQPNCRFVLLTAEPGAGKSTFMAQLAADHPPAAGRPTWLRYFIRRDQRTPLGDVGVRSFLLRIGYQLAALHPDLFTQERVQLSVEQRIGEVEAKGEVVGAVVKRVLASPFYQKAVEVRQHVERNAGRIVGLKLEELVIETRQLDPSDLQYMALLDPARALLQRDPVVQIVVLVDALDEIRYHDVEDNILKWLTNCPELPPNIHFVLTSRRPDTALQVFCDKQRPFVQRLTIDPESEPVQHDVQVYVDRLVAQPQIAAELASTPQGVGAFAVQLAEKANGNLGYLDALARALDSALARKDAVLLRATLDLRNLPDELEDLYAFFLHQIQVEANDLAVGVTVPDSYKPLYLPAWPAVYMPLLGVLAVAAEPLTPDQMKDFGGIDADPAYVKDALGCLHQFLDDVDGRYRLYHATVPDFLTDPSTKANPQTNDLYQDSAVSHRRILHYYQQLVGDWPAARWSEMDRYGWRHLLAHAEQAGVERPAPVLFVICDAGFLEAKRQAMTSAVALEEDWTRSLQACRAAGDYARFVRYGLQRARQFMEISPLLSTPVARTAARLAVRRGSEAAVNRLAAEMALIPHLHARIGAEQALLDELIATAVKYPALERLARSLHSALTTLPSGEDRDSYLVNYVGALARAQRRGWQETVRSYLDEVKSLLPRVSLLAILARGCAEDDDLQTALHLLQEALEQCQGVTIGDDFVPDLLQMMTGAERVPPATILANALGAILSAAPSLGAQDCANVVAATRTQFDRIMDQFDLSEAALLLLNLNRLAIDALDAAGLRDLAQEMAREVMQPYLRMAADEDATGAIQGLVQPWAAVELLALLPILAHFGAEHDREVWWHLFRGCLADVGSALDLLWIAETASDLSTADIGASEVNAVLEAVEERAEALSLDEVGFAIAGNLALGYGRANNPVHARDLVSRVLDQVSAQQLGPCQYPEQAAGRANGLTAVWAAACSCGERDLVERTLAWLKEIASTVVPFNNRAVVWRQAIPSVRDLPDLDLASDVFDQLKLRMVENVERGPFLATACQQFGDAYTELAMPAEAQRLLADCVRLAHTTMDEKPLVELLALAASNYARLGDIEASTGLLRGLLQVIPRIEGDNIQADRLDYDLIGIGALASVSPSGKAAAARLLDEATGIAQLIGLDEYALRALAAVVRTAAAHDLAAPVDAMTVRLRKLKEPWDKTGLVAVLQVAWALHQAGKERDAQQLLGQVEAAVEHMPREADYERQAVCQGCAELIAFCDAMGALQQSTHWRELAGALAGQIQDPTFRTSACAELARIEARCKDSRSAGTWLAEAIDAWHRIEERFYASPYIGDIYRAWDAIPDPEERWGRVDILHTVFYRVADLDERDTWQARLAISFLDDRARFWELMAPVVSQGGIDVLLSALHHTKSVPSEILPEALYDLLEKASRLSRLGFAGFGLLATQAGVCHQALDSQAAVSALETLEATIREVVTMELPTI